MVGATGIEPVTPTCGTSVNDARQDHQALGRCVVAFRRWARDGAVGCRADVLWRAHSEGSVKSYILHYRVGAGRGAPLRKLAIGKHGSPWTPETARAEAKRLLVMVVLGKDP